MFRSSIQLETVPRINKIKTGRKRKYLLLELNNFLKETTSER
jgi:hypothetical protein